MLKRARTITGQDQKRRRADDRDEVQGQEQNELGDLSEGERGVLGRPDGRFTKHLQRIPRRFPLIAVDGPRRSYQVEETQIDENLWM